MGLGEDVIACLAEGRSLDDARVTRDGTGRWVLSREALAAAGDQHGWLPPAKLRGVTLDSIDFRGVSWERVGLVDCTVSNCRFDECVLDDWYVESLDCRDCSFRGAKLSRFGMGGRVRRWRPKPTAWVNVDFSAADLRDTRHSQEVFEGCDFSRARLDGVDFDGAVHVRSVFAGQLRDVIFRRKPEIGRGARGMENRMAGVDFSQARLRFCEFWDLGLEEALLPVADANLAYRPKVGTARAVLARLDELGNPAWSRTLRVLMERDVIEGPDTQTALGIVDLTSVSGAPEIRAQAAHLICENASWSSARA